MEILTISGGSGLFGEVRIPGAKNSVLPIMAASVLCRGTVTLTDVPHLSDVEASARILQSVGCKVLLENGRAVITPPEFPGSAVPEPLMRAMRSSLFYLAPLLARTGRADIYTPGGCRLGARPIDMHLSGLEKMGAHITEKDGGALEVTAPDGLAGADICLRFPSVGATETLLMAAAAARGETVLRGAAVEPEVTDLARFLQGAGADITGVGTRVLHIRGRELLMGTQHAVCPDRITAATVLCAVAGCGGEVLLTNTCNAHLAEVLRILRRAGCMVSVSGDSSVALASSGALRAAGQGLQPQRARPGKQVQHLRAAHARLQDVEERLPRSVERRAGVLPFQRRKFSPSGLPGNDSHASASSESNLRSYHHTTKAGPSQQKPAGF